jgi:hypothetical protein
VQPNIQLDPPEPRSVASPTISRAYKCHHCGKPIFLRNSVCINCGTAAGYDPSRRTMVSLTPLEEPGVFELVDEPGSRVMTCANLSSAAGCSWLIPANAQGGFDYANQYPGFCLSCSLNRTVPDLAGERNQELWRRMEIAKRRLVSQLLALGLPVETRLERPDDGLAFDFLESVDGGARVMTGHDNGLITLNIEEADDARRESLRAALHEPYRTLLGHFRHEIGHYYWDRLVRGSAAIGHYRALFGDERQDYAQALQRHYNEGPAPDWMLRHVSSYATAHPWEDWAESWAHYLHMCDTVDTALSFAINADGVDMQAVPFEKKDLWQPERANADQFLSFLNTWVRLTNVLNELSRAMGQPDYYPFILPHAAVGKLQFIHEIVRGAGVIEPVKNPIPVVEAPVVEQAGQTAEPMAAQATAQEATQATAQGAAQTVAQGTTQAAGQTTISTAVQTTAAAVEPGAAPLRA